MNVVSSLHGQRCVVATVEGELVGFLTLRCCTECEAEEAADLLAVDVCSSSRGREVAYILTLGVAQRFRRRGVANSLLRAALLSLPCQLVYLHVLTSNETALSFYKSHNFQLLRREPGFYVLDKTSHDAFCLCLYRHGGRPPLSASGALVGLLARRVRRAADALLSLFS